MLLPCFSAVYEKHTSCHFLLGSSHLAFCLWHVSAEIYDLRVKKFSTSLHLMAHTVTTYQTLSNFFCKYSTRHIWGYAPMQEYLNISLDDKGNKVSVKSLGERFRLKVSVNFPINSLFSIEKLRQTRERMCFLRNPQRLITAAPIKLEKKFCNFPNVLFSGRFWCFRFQGQFTPDQLYRYYSDLTNPEFVTHIAVVHSRFSTNTLPSWCRAQPNRYFLVPLSFILIHFWYCSDFK